MTLFTFRLSPMAATVLLWKPRFENDIFRANPMPDNPSPSEIDSDVADLTPEELRNKLRNLLESLQE
jgi:hypothetical protein